MMDNGANTYNCACGRHVGRHSVGRTACDTVDWWFEKASWTSGRITHPWSCVLSRHMDRTLGDAHQAKGSFSGAFIQGSHLEAWLLWAGCKLLRIGLALFEGGLRLAVDDNRMISWLRNWRFEGKSLVVMLQRTYDCQLMMRSGYMWTHRGLCMSVSLSDAPIFRASYIHKEQNWHPSMIM